jgi:predicted ATPase
MFTKIEALRFRCLRYVCQPIKGFHLLVGPNASGKTTFLDVIAFLGQLVGEGLDAALNERTRNLQDMVWQRSDLPFELAVEAKLPESNRQKLSDRSFDTIRYEVSVGSDLHGETVILGEKCC